ncbi:MAG: tetratricopeptide repeat protein [Bacteroidales bacterium]|nr:tetratricopeptide repeat protein [Bacteroidales bacterium]
MKRIEIGFLSFFLVSLILSFLVKLNEYMVDVVPFLITVLSAIYLVGGYFIFKPKKEIKYWKLLAIVNGILISLAFVLVLGKFIENKISFFVVFLYLIPLLLLIIYLAYKYFQKSSEKNEKLYYRNLLTRSAIIFLISLIISIIPEPVFVKHFYGENSEIYYELEQWDRLNQASALITYNEFQKAKDKLNKVVYYSKLHNDVSSVRYQKCLNELAYVNYLLGDYITADSIVDITLKLYKYDLPEDIPNKYDIIYQKQYYRANYYKALLFSSMHIPYISDSLFAITLNYYSDDKSLSSIYYRLGNNKNIVGNYKNADSLYRLSVLYREKADIKDDLYLWTITDMAKNSINMFNYRRADSLLSICYNIAKSQYGANHLETTRVLDANMILNLQLANYDKAQENCVESMAIKEKNMGNESYGYLQSSLDLATIYLSTSKYNKADSLLKEIERIIEYNFDLRGPLATRLFDELSTYNRDFMDFDKAYYYANKSLNGRIYTRGMYHINTATSYHNLAAALYYQSKYSQADSLYTLSLDIKRYYSGYGSPSYTNSLNGLALVYIEYDSLNEAESYLDYCLESNEISFGTNHPNYAAILSNIAYLRVEQNQISDAKSYYLSALYIYENTYMSNHIQIARVYYELGNIEMNRDKIDKALDYYLKANEIYETLLGNDHYFVNDLKRKIENIKGDSK